MFNICHILYIYVYYFLFLYIQNPVHIKKIRVEAARHLCSEAYPALEVDRHPDASMTLTLDVGGAGMSRLYHALLSVEPYAIHMYS